MDVPEDSPVAWVNEHIEAYVATGGATGHHFHGATALLLTVTGRTSGVPRRTALYYVRDGDRFVVVASQGGAPTHPQWYLNVQTDPRVTVQVGADVFEATASTAEGDDRQRLWGLSVQNWPAYDDYAAKTDREIPVVVLTRARR
jgi:deazaflavin-dependent oxidoreductase (nitroreductase family)